MERKTKMGFIFAFVLGCLVTSIPMILSQGPTQGHPASEIRTGTFGAGDYAFPNNLGISGNLDMNGNNILNVNLLNGGIPWTSANDGSGSGLDADYLDGHNTSYFQREIGADCGANDYVYGVSDGGTLKCRADQTGGLPSGTSGQTLRHDGTTWVANSVLFNDGTNIGTTGSLYVEDDIVLQDAGVDKAWIYTNANGDLFLTPGGTGQILAIRTLRPIADNNYDLGTSTYAWKDLYVSNQICLNGDCQSSWSNGWHGSKTRIKILPRDFVTDCSSGYGQASIFGVGIATTDPTICDLVAFVPIPAGFKATHVRIYAGATYDVTVYENDITDATFVQKNPAGTTTAAEIDITDVTSTSTNYLSIRVDTTDTYFIYGGYVTITKV